MANNVIEKHPEIWPPHGDIVFIAKSTAFKVDSSLMSGVSEVFRDLIKHLQPASDIESQLFEGLPCIVLQETAEDVFYLLSALTKGLSLPKRNFKGSAYCRAVLRLSHKYKVTIFRPVLEQHFCAMYPTTLADYDRRLTIDQQFLRALQSRTSSTSRLSTLNAPLFTLWPYNFSMDIVMAKEIGLDSVLPCAFYGLCICMHEQPGTVGAWLNGLDVEDCQRIIRGQSIISTKLASLYTIPASTCLEGSTCATRSQCSTTLGSWKSEFERKWTSLPILGPLHMLNKLILAVEAMKPAEDFLCMLCQRSLLIFFRMKRTALWNELPEIFDLPKQISPAHPTWDSVDWDPPEVHDL